MSIVLTFSFRTILVFFNERGPPAPLYRMKQKATSHKFLREINYYKVEKAVIKKSAANTIRVLALVA